MRASSVTITEVGSNARDLLALRYEWHDMSATDTQFDERFHEWWRSERHHRRATVALTSEERPVGMANALIYSRMPSPGRPPARWLYAANVFVSPEFRRQGIAGPHSCRNWSSTPALRAWCGWFSRRRRCRNRCIASSVFGWLTTSCASISPESVARGDDLLTLA